MSVRALVSILLLACSSPVFAALSVSATANNDDAASGGAITATLAGNIPAGAAVIVFTQCSDTTASTGSVADGLANSFTSVGAGSIVIADRSFRVFKYLNHPGGTTTVTFTPPSTSTLRGIFVFVVVSGTASQINDVDTQRQQQTDPGTGTDAVTTPALTMTAGGVIVAISRGATGSALSAGTGWTSNGLAWSTRIRAENRVFASSGTPSATWTTSAATDDPVSLAVALQEVVGQSNAPRAIHHLNQQARIAPNESLRAIR